MWCLQIRSDCLFGGRSDTDWHSSDSNTAITLFFFQYASYQIAQAIDVSGIKLRMRRSQLKMVAKQMSLMEQRADLPNLSPPSQRL